MNIKIKEADELDQATQYFTTLIQEAAWYSTPMPLETTKHSHNIPLHIRELKSAEQGTDGKGHETKMTVLIIINLEDDWTTR
jgi:hypothetical protein